MFGIVTSRLEVVNFLIDQQATREELISVTSADMGLAPVDS